MSIKQLTNEELTWFVLQGSQGNEQYILPPKDLPPLTTGEMKRLANVEIFEENFVTLAHETANRMLKLQARVKELEEQVKGMIPKPDVEVYECDSSWYVRINGSDVLADNPLNYYKAQLWFEEVKRVLGMKGGA